MGTVSAGVLSFFMVATILIGVQSLPDGCTKMVGSPKNGIPGEFIVKIESSDIIKIMSQLNASVHNGKPWRSSNTSSAVMEPINCTIMWYLVGFGFAAKMSDSAVIWVSEQLYEWPACTRHSAGSRLATYV